MRNTSRSARGTYLGVNLSDQRDSKQMLAHLPARGIGFFIDPKIAIVYHDGYPFHIHGTRQAFYGELPCGCDAEAVSRSWNYWS